MAGDKFDQLYNALKNDGAVSGTREDFKSYVLAKGKQGYMNRLSLYNALKNDGAVSSNSYEEFVQKLGLHAVKPQQTVKKQSSKPQTTAQKAMQIGGRQLPKPKTVPENASPFVQALYSQDYVKDNEARNRDVTTPIAQVYKRNKEIERSTVRGAADRIVNDEQRRKNTPIMQTGRPEDILSKTQGQLEKDMSDAADKLVASSGDFIKNSIDNEYKQADLKAHDEIRDADGLSNPFMGLSAGLITTQIANKYVSPDKIMESLQKSIAKNITKILPQAEEQAKALGVSSDAYLKQIVLPKMIDKAVGQFTETEIARCMPKSDLEYFFRQAANSNTLGTIWSLLSQTKAQRQFNEEAMNRTNEGKNPNYKPGTALKVSADVFGMATDPIFHGYGKAGGWVAGKLIGSGAKTAAVMANGTLAQRLMSQGAQVVTGNATTGFLFEGTESVIQNYSTGEDTSLGNTLKVAAKGGTHGAVSFSIMGLAGVPLNQAGRSIGIKAGGSFWGNTGRAVGKVGLESAKTVMEGMGMYLGGYTVGKMEGATDANGKPIEFDLWNGTLESLPTAVGFRVQHALEGLKGGRKNAKGESMGWLGSTVANMKDFLTSDKAKVSNMLMSEDEKSQIFNSGVQNGVMRNGENIVAYAQKTKKNKLKYDDPQVYNDPEGKEDIVSDVEMMQSSYDKIMADPKVSWDAKAKFSAMVMGIMPESRPMMDYCTFTYEKVGGNEAGYKKYVNEYSAKGELLSKTSYDTTDKREQILYNMRMTREQRRIWNAMSLLVQKDKSNYDYQNAFYMHSIKNAKDNAEIQAFVDGMGTAGSAVERDFTSYLLNNGSVMKLFEAFAQERGMKKEDLIKVINKDPLKRTEAEQLTCVQLRREIEKQAFPENKVHGEQSNLEGKDVAEDNKLGTEQPNGESVKQELNNLAEAEKGMEILMRDNDVFEQNFKELQKKGFTTPQIYDWMVQQGGMTEEQLKPFADYINANARVQGMQQATQQKMEEAVGAMVQDWSYHGTIDGLKCTGEQVIYVTDKDGRTLIVGSGDVAFNSTTGRAKEDVGDMLVCFDPNKREMVYIKAEEVTLAKKITPEEFGNAYRQKLQEINSQAYMEAAAEQAERNANMPQEEKKTEGASEEVKQKEGEKTEEVYNRHTTAKQPVETVGASQETEQGDTQVSPSMNAPTTSRAKDSNNSSNGNGLEATLTFEDGSAVPMTKDKKGRPTPDYSNMKPEQAAEILTKQLGGNAEPYVDAQIKAAQKAVKNAEKMKIDYNGDPNDIVEQQQVKDAAIAAAKQQLEHTESIKKAMAARKVAETMKPKTASEEAPAQENVHTAGSVAGEKFDKATKIKGRKGTRTLADGTKIKGTFMIVPAESLTPSHDVSNRYKKSEGFPVNEEGRTINDRDYEHDKDAQDVTDKIAANYDGQAVNQVPTVSDEGIVYDGNGRTMAGQLAAKRGTDKEYVEALKENAEGFGVKAEDIDKIEHPRVVFIPDERLPYDTETFARFNRNEKKSQSNTQEAIANSKKLSAEDVGAIVGEMETSGSLDSFFNNPKAINSLLKTLVEKGVIGQNDIAGLKDGDLLSAKGKEFVQNLLLGSMFKEDTLRMLGIEKGLKSKALSAMRSIMDNAKLGEYSLRDEIDSAIQLLYEAKRGGYTVDGLLRQPDMYQASAAERYPIEVQIMAKALEGKVGDFKELLEAYNRNAETLNTGEGDMFGEHLTKEEFINEILKLETWKKYDTRKENKAEQGTVDDGGTQRSEPETRGDNEETQRQVTEALKTVATEITKESGVEVVTDEKVAQKALDEAEKNGEDIKKQPKAGGAVLDWGNVPNKARLDNDELTTIIMQNNREYIDELNNLPEGETIEHYVDANGYFYTFRVDKDHHIYMDEAIPKTSSANKERINELKKYFDEERARYSETLRSDRGETQSELGRLADTDGSTIGGRDSQDSAVGRGSERTDTKGAVERDTSRTEQSGSPIKQFRSKDGEVYGFVHDGKIYLDLKRMKPETPLHEYAHLWTESLKRVNPKEWENVKKLFDDVEGLKEEVQKLYPELKGDDLYEEMITTFSGREGAKKLEDVVRRLAKEDGKSVTESVKANGFIHKVKEALQKYWKGVADMLHIHFTTAEEVADKVLADWASGVNPREGKSKEPSKDPMEGLKNAELSYHEEKIDAARKAYQEAKASGDESEIKRTRDELKKTLDDKLKAQHVGLVQRRKEIAKELGTEEAEKIDKPWKDMDGEERMATAEKNPLTEDEIRNHASEDNQDLIEDAVDYLNGNHGFAQQLAYLKIYDDVRNRHENVPDNSGTEDAAQLAATDTTSGEGLGMGTGRESRGITEPMDSGTGGEAASRERDGGKGNQTDPALPAGEPSNKQGEGATPDMGGLSTRGVDTNGSGAVGTNGGEPKQGGRGSSSRPAKPDAKRKPTAKQGTTWRNRTGAEIKQEAKDAKAGLKAALAEMLKRGRGEVSISLVGLNSKQIEYVPELMKAVKRYGMSLIDQGIYKIKDWMNNIREGIYEDMKAIGFSDRDIDDFIEEMWNSKMPMDGETHTIAEWCSIYGQAQLRKKLGEELGGKYQRQLDAESIEVKVGDRKNIEETLPFLLPQQQDDVLRAETQFFGNEHTDREHAYGKGYMFTNGTGTGKTYTGLGIAKRLQKQGKGRILFLTPSQTKVQDWIKDGRNLNLTIRDLDSVAKEKGTTATTESGEGMVITTYANFRMNKKLLEENWDAVIYDESHRIMENKKGSETAGSMQHYMVSNRDESHCFLRLQETNKDYQKMRSAADKFGELRGKEIQRIQKEYKDSHPGATSKDVINATHKMLPKEINSFAPADATTFPELGKAYQDFMTAREHYYKEVEPKLREQAKNEWQHTKVVFLSATPFNTRENLDYAEGYIFKYPERGEDGMDGRTRFYLDHFGAAYKYRYHRLEQSTSNPDAVAKQEIAFSDYLQHTLGTMSGRIIDSPYDYSRDFPTVSPDHAEQFNQAVQDAVRGRYLGAAYTKTIGDYNYGSALFETMKVANIIERIKGHLDAGRKVVIFHRRVETKTPLQPPFAYMLEYANKMIAEMRPGKERNEAIRECNEFRQKYAELLQWEQTLDYSMPREQIAKVFGKDNVLFFSGKESKKEKNKAVDVFNDDNSGKNIIVIQEASGKEGISLHDTTGNHQRVCITLGLPQSPITALQIEGRTYRIGNKSNAIFEYPILGLNSEMMLFGQKFNNQVSTTENLALGSQARNLRDSFANGILEHSGVVPIDQQGVGGKEFDAPKQSESDPFDDAVLDYYSNQKLNKRNREGVDYFPTPEPLGYKMMEWAKAGEGDTILEPSAGHGAIARYAPKGNQMTSIEPSQTLFAKLQLKAGGLGRKFLNNIFENYDISNKHDVVVMNPPFGTAGATAIAHLDKAFKHLDEGGRVVAIIPRGSTDKKFDKWMDGQKNVAMRAEIDLPDIVFQQAGTSVRCRVVVLDKITDDVLRSKAGYPEKIDLSGHYDKIEDFFEDLRDIDMPERIIDTQAKMLKKARTTVRDIKEIKGVRGVSLAKDGILVTLRGEWRDYGISFQGSDNPRYWRERMSQYYDKYNELQKTSWSEDKQAVCEEMKNLACKLAGMTEEEMKRYIVGRKNTEGEGEVHFRMEDDIEDVNRKFNERLESLKAEPNQKDHELHLGYPGRFLSDAGLGYAEIVMDYDRLVKKSSPKYGKTHPFELDDIKNLPLAINSPIAVFDNTNGENLGKVILTEIKKDNNNFVVAIRATERHKKGGIILEVNEIKTLFPKEARGIVNWFNTGKTCNVDKEKALTWLGALRSHCGTELTEQELSSAANVVKGFDIAKQKTVNFRIGDIKEDELNNSVTSVSKDAPVVVKHIDEVSKKTGSKVNMVQSAEEVTNPKVKQALDEGKPITGWYDENTDEVHLYMPNIHDRYTAEKTIWHETVGHKGMRGLMGEHFYEFLRDVWYDLDKPENAELKKLVEEERKRNPLNIYDAIEEGIARLVEDGKGEPGFWTNIKNKITDFFHEIGYRIAPNTKDVKYLLWLSKNLQKNPNDSFYKMRADAVKWRLEHEYIPSVIEANGMYYDNDGKARNSLLDMGKVEFEEATDGKVHFRTTPMTASKIEEYNRILGTKLYAFKESTIDNMQALQEAMKLISGVKHVWEDIPSAFNPLQAQNRMDGMVQQKADKYDRKITEPLDKVFKKLVSAMDGKNKDEKLRNAQLYMITKHGLERNRVFFVRDAINNLMKDETKRTQAEALRTDWMKKQVDLATDLQKGKIRFDEYINQMDEWICNNVDKKFVAAEHDYSGFHGMQGLDKSVNYDDKLAIDNVMSAESKLGKSLVEGFWKKKTAATDFVIEQEYANGFIDKNKRDYLKGMFQWYVPLRKFDEVTAEDIYGYVTENGDPSNNVGSVLAKAEGRYSLSDVNVMAQITAMAKSSLINGGKNVVKQHFARFVAAYEKGDIKDRIFVEVNPWLVKYTINGNDVWVEETPNIPKDATQEQIADILQNFEESMQAKKAKGEAKLISQKADIGFKFQRAKDKSEHIIDVYVAGKKRRFVCQGNPRAAQALNGLLKDSGARNAVSKFDATVTRKVAQFNTSYAPDFMMSNLFRDLTFASANVTKEGVGYTAKFLKEYARNVQSIRHTSGKGNYLTMYRRYRNDKLDMNNEHDRLFKEFMDNGGQTGFVSVKKLNDLVEEYNNLIKKGNKEADSWLMKNLKSGGAYIEAANEIIEGIARYSTYCTSRKIGRSIGRSIYDAKEVSTNFNRHGSGDAINTLKTATDSKNDKRYRATLGFFNSWMKNHTQFYNAGVQGANLFFKNYKTAPITASIAFGFMPFGLGLAQAVINQYLISIEDEKDRKGQKDPYAELPEWKRRNNICIYTGHGNFKTIPIAIELRAFFGLGDIAAGYVVNDNLKSNTPIGYDILGQMAQLVPASDFLGHHTPGGSLKEIGEDVLLSATPTTIRAAAELGFNRDWTGRPIYRDKDYLNMAPRWKSAYDSTNDVYMTVNKWANKNTNGMDDDNEDMRGNATLDYLTSPYGWQHLIEGFTGGAGATVGRAYNTAKAVVKSVDSGMKDEEGFGKGFSKEWEKFDKNQIPLYRVFNYSPSEGSEMQRTKSKWFNYTDELKQTEYNVKQWKTNSADPVKNLEMSAKRYDFLHGKGAQRYNVWKAADDYISKKNRDLKKVSDPDTRKAIEDSINIKMQEAVSDLDKLNE